MPRPLPRVYENPRQKTGNVQNESSGSRPDPSGATCSKPTPPSPPPARGGLPDRAPSTSIPQSPPQQAVAKDTNRVLPCEASTTTFASWNANGLLIAEGFPEKKGKTKVRA